VRALPNLVALEEQLAAIVGADNVATGDAAKRAFTGDQSWLSYVAAGFGEQASRQDAVVQARTTEDVTAILKLANQLHVPVTPLGGGSGVQGAANADRGGILLDLRAMNQIRSIDEQSLTATVECGMICSEFEATLNARGLRFTHYPASAEWASIGGCVTARGSGVLSTKYGKIEDHVLALEIVLPTGEIVHTPPVPRHAAGPELAQLLVGSEGTLGVVTAVTVQLRRLPARQVFSCFAFDHLSDGISAGREIMLSGLRPAVMRLYDELSAAGSLERVVRAGLQTPTFITMCDGDHDEVVDAEAEAVARILSKNSGRDLGAKIAQDWWNNRYAFYKPPHAPELPQIWATIDVVADFSHIENVYDAVTTAIRGAVDSKWNLSLGTHFSHWYPWGSMIYARFKIPQGPDTLAESMALHDAIIRDATHTALGAGAVLNDHHGVGMRLGPYMQEQLGPTGMEMLSRIKRGLDPNGILCPGKLGLPAAV
jgi:alkyldihydroxyacetonephosphate synthase